MPPMRKSSIFKPLSSHESTVDLKKIYQDICTGLTGMKMSSDSTFDEFLQQLSITEETYILAIRSSLTRDQLFLKRSPGSIRINSYDTFVLRAWQANMDMKFVLDPYACAMYIASYINKSERGISNILKRAAEEAKAGNKYIKTKSDTLVIISLTVLK